MTNTTQQIKLIKTAAAVEKALNASIDISTAYQYVRKVIFTTTNTTASFIYARILKSANISSISMQLATSSDVTPLLPIIRGYDELCRLQFTPAEAFRFLAKATPDVIAALPNRALAMRETLTKIQHCIESLYLDEEIIFSLLEPTAEEANRVYYTASQVQSPDHLSGPISIKIKGNNSYQIYEGYILRMDYELLSNASKLELQINARAEILYQHYLDTNNNIVINGRTNYQIEKDRELFWDIIHKLENYNLLTSSGLYTDAASTVLESLYPKLDIRQIAADQVMHAKAQGLRKPPLSYASPLRPVVLYPDVNYEAATSPTSQIDLSIFFDRLSSPVESSTFLENTRMRAIQLLRNFEKGDLVDGVTLSSLKLSKYKFRKIITALINKGLITTPEKFTDILKILENKFVPIPEFFDIAKKQLLSEKEFYKLVVSGSEIMSQQHSTTGYLLSLNANLNTAVAPQIQPAPASPSGYSKLIAAPLLLLGVYAVARCWCPTLFSKTVNRIYGKQHQDDEEKAVSNVRRPLTRHRKSLSE